MSRKTQLEILSKRRQSYKADPDMIPSTHSLIISALLFLNFCPLYSSFPPLFSLPSTFFNLSLHIYAAFSFVPLLLSHHQSSCATLNIPYLSKPFFPYENSVQSHPISHNPYILYNFYTKKGPLRAVLSLFPYSMILVTTPAPTVLPPSRIANRNPSSIAICVISLIVICTLSPGITISTPSGNSMTPVTSVVLK